MSERFFNCELDSQIDVRNRQFTSSGPQNLIHMSDFGVANIWLPSRRSCVERKYNKLKDNSESPGPYLICRGACSFSDLPKAPHGFPYWAQTTPTFLLLWCEDIGYGSYTECPLLQVVILCHLSLLSLGVSVSYFCGWSSTACCCLTSFLFLVQSGKYSYRPWT
jgi:hypothetical protein